MDEIKLSDDVFEQIKDFDYRQLTEEQESLIDKLILNEELKERYKRDGLCKICKQLNTNDGWCQSIPSHLKQNFKSWTSGNNVVDKFIREAQLKAKNRYQILEWIEYDKFEDIEYLAKGGFGTTYKAIWKDDPFWEKNYGGEWQKNGETKVALKCLHNSQDISAEFFKELESNIIASESGLGWVVRCFGITKDPKTNNFMMVMELQKCSLRQLLNDNFNSLSWGEKMDMLYGISIGLKDIHDSGLIHRDFHCGNLLSDIESSMSVCITDLGLCQPANVKSSQGDNKKIYGVLPYVAPEVLRGKEYTQASDIYGFGIIAYEICTGLPPYHKIAHDELLTISICQGLRPKSNYKIPQLIIDIINQCWDADPLKRPEANDLYELISNLYHYYNEEDSDIYKQIKEANEINDKSSSTVQSPSLSASTLSYVTHPQAVYTSRLLDFKNLPEPKNADNNDVIPGIEYSESLNMDFTKLDINSKGESN
ncbi:hypothetical protein RclHR1_09750002 [Rhizophagus clarus]|uniref:Kinase-like domain-containing protein n=1 Tax=Rhizophagus clarus TaxID=94130 RepID=A0A2Z6SFC5_9GLOM|nr:hypothetical protein RclHR1_09750002 [Rhizophagus clarus]GES79936.1 kinase-like domain-containing protein [Rhizophagus clarus]